MEARAREMWIVEVRRPSLDSVTVKMAGPRDVRRRKLRCRNRVCGWFWARRVVEKWTEATRRKQEVT